MIGLAVLAGAIVFFALRKDLGSKKASSGQPDRTVPEVSALNLREMLTASPAPVVVLFHSPNCPACHTQKPYFAEAAATHKGDARFVTIDVKDNKSTARRLGISRIPTTMVFAKTDETPLDSRVGVFDPASVNAFIANALK